MQRNFLESVGSVCGVYTSFYFTLLLWRLIFFDSIFFFSWKHTFLSPSRRFPARKVSFFLWGRKNFLKSISSVITDSFSIPMLWKSKGLARRLHWRMLHLASVPLKYCETLAKHKQPQPEENQICAQKKPTNMFEKLRESVKHWGGETELWLTLYLFSTCKALDCGAASGAKSKWAARRERAGTEAARRSSAF